MKTGSLVLKNGSMVRPSNCIEADGSWHTKEKYPKLYEIFRDCKCLHPHFDEVTGIVNSTVKGIFHLPKSYGKAWIIYKENL
jgi:hypothetical protein